LFLIRAGLCYRVELTRLMVHYNVGCRVEETLYLRKVDEDFFAD